MKNGKWALRGLVAVLLLAVLAAWLWQSLRPRELGAGFASGNGRVEAIQVDIATKLPGRVAEILVDEGDAVTAGQVLARMDTHALQAQHTQAAAQARQAARAQATAAAVVTQRRSELASAGAALRQREAERELAARRLRRTQQLQAEQAVSAQLLEEAQAALRMAQAAVDAARAQIAAAEAGIQVAQSQAAQAQAAAEAAQATVAQLQADLDDSVLKAPRGGRIQYRVAQPGEVLAGGGTLLSMVDLNDVYMTFFLPETVAGRVAIGSEVRIVLDAAPQFVIPARVSYVASVAQFTPKTVETASERQKLMFRVKARLDREVLAQHPQQVKSGLPGVAYVRVAASAPWPERLALKPSP